MIGDVHSVNTVGCLLSPPPMESDSQKSLQLLVSSTIFQCALDAFSHTAVLDSLADLIVDQYLSLDNRITFTQVL